MAKAGRIPHGRGPKQGFVLLCAAGAGVLSDARIDPNGAPVKTYVKDLIRAGDWVHPSTGEAFKVTNKDLDEWAAEFSRMQANGVKVHVPSGHTNEPDANRGYVVGMFREGDTLYGRIELIGEDAIAMASRTEVSIYVPESLKDGKGNEYRRPIEHVALTPVPVISGQGKFVPVSLSRGQVEAPAYRLAQEFTMNPMLVSLAKMCGIDPADKTDQDLHDAIAVKLNGMAQADTEKQKMESDLKCAREELAQAKKGDAPTDPTLLKLARDNRAMKIERLRLSGKLIPAQEAALKAAWTPADSKALALSLTPTADAMFDGTIAAFDAFDPKILGEQTKHVLSREVPGDNKPPSGEAAIKAARELMGVK